MEEITIITAIFGLISAIVRWTPTKKDDEVETKWGWLLKMLFEGTRRYKEKK